MVACHGGKRCAFADNPQSTRPVWQIGHSDNNTAEFALGPGESGRFTEEFGAGTLYQVGVSEARLTLLQFYIYSPCY